jgi:hypothetical protein
MNQKFIIVDDFYEIAHKTLKDFHQEGNFLQTEFGEEIVGEITEKVSSILNQPVQVGHVFNELTPKDSPNIITSNTQYDWIAIIYLNLPTETHHLGRGLSFYLHKSTGLDCFPNDLACKVNGLQNIDDIIKCFDGNNQSYWKEYMNIYVKYNRMVLFRADLWHSYGVGFGNELNNSMKHQKVLIKNVR